MVVTPVGCHDRAIPLAAANVLRAMEDADKAIVRDTDEGSVSTGWFAGEVRISVGMVPDWRQAESRAE
jgi:hypothetical protein